MFHIFRRRLYYFYSQKITTAKDLKNKLKCKRNVLWEISWLAQVHTAAERGSWYRNSSHLMIPVSNPNVSLPIPWCSWTQLKQHIIDVWVIRTQAVHGIMLESITTLIRLRIQASFVALLNFPSLASCWHPHLKYSTMLNSLLGPSFQNVLPALDVKLPQRRQPWNSVRHRRWPGKLIYPSQFQIGLNSKITGMTF